MARGLRRVSVEYWKDFGMVRCTLNPLILPWLTVDSESTLSTAEALAQNDSHFTNLSKVSMSCSERMKFNSIVAEACYVSSLLSLSKGDYKNAGRYARQNVLLNRRTWAARESNVNSRKVASTDAPLTEMSSGANIDPSSSVRNEISAPLISSITHDALKGPEFWSLIPPLYRALVQHSVVLASQGMLEEAIYMLQQAEKVASAMGSRALLVDITSRLAELWIQSGRPDKAQLLFDGLDVLQSDNRFSTIRYHLSVAKMHHVSHKFEAEIAEYDILEKMLRHLSSPSYINSVVGFAYEVDALTSDLSTLTLQEPKPADVQHTRSVRKRATTVKALSKATSKPTTRTIPKMTPKSASTAVSKLQNRSLLAPTVETYDTGEQCRAIDALQIDVIYRRAAVHLLQGDVMEAMVILSRTEKSEKDRDGYHAWVRFKSMLAQAIRSISDDFTFNTLPESTIAFPAIPSKSRRSSEGIPAKRPSPQSTLRAARGKKQAGDDFVQLVENAREQLAEAHAQYASAASNHVFRQLCAALNHATILLSAVSQGRIRGSIHPLYSAYMSGMCGVVSLCVGIANLM